MRVLVTGANGFVGRYLVKHLLSHGHNVGILELRSSDIFSSQAVRQYTADILDYDAVKSCMLNFIPDAVIHLAAQSNVGLAWDKATLTAQVNVVGTINVLNALYEANSAAKFINIGSGDEYGNTAKTNELLNEEMPCVPQNPYGISKLCAEQMVLKLEQKLGMTVLSTRSFNHFGPYQAKGFVVSDFASQIAAIKCGKQETVIQVGDLSVARDFLYVEDVVDAYIKLLECNVASGVYNVASGKAITIQSILDGLLKLANTDITVEIDKKKFRPVEVKSFAGDNSKLVQATGWKPKYDIRDNLKSTLEYWVRVIRE